MPDRAILFIDGNNWYHAVKDGGVREPMRLDYSAISNKLVGPRDWLGTRYYIGALKQSWNPQDYANQRRFLSLIRQDDARISVHLGRLEERYEDNPLAEALTGYVDANRHDLPEGVRRQLQALAAAHERVVTLKEKAVDIMISVDMYRMAMQDEFDAAYLLSADGDYTPLVGAVRGLGKKVYAACPNYGSALAQTANSFIVLKEDWFHDCYR